MKETPLVLLDVVDDDDDGTSNNLDGNKSIGDTIDTNDDDDTDWMCRRLDRSLFELERDTDRILDDIRNIATDGTPPSSSSTKKKTSQDKTRSGPTIATKHDKNRNRSTKQTSITTTTTNCPVRNSQPNQEFGSDMILRISTDVSISSNHSDDNYDDDDNTNRTNDDEDSIIGELRRLDSVTTTIRLSLIDTTNEASLLLLSSSSSSSSSSSVQQPAHTVATTTSAAAHSTSSKTNNNQNSIETLSSPDNHIGTTKNAVALDRSVRIPHTVLLDDRTTMAQTEAVAVGVSLSISIGFIAILWMSLFYIILWWSPKQQGQTNSTTGTWFPLLNEEGRIVLRWYNE